MADYYGQKFERFPVPNELCPGAPTRPPAPHPAPAPSAVTTSPTAPQPPAGACSWHGVCYNDSRLEFTQYILDKATGGPPPFVLRCECAQGREGLQCERFLPDWQARSPSPPARLPACCRPCVPACVRVRAAG